MTHPTPDDAHRKAVEAAAEAMRGRLHPELPDAVRLWVAEAAVTAAAPHLLAPVEAEAHHSMHGLPGHPCHELYSRCFRTDADLREYRVRQRKHGARMAVAAERRRIAAAIQALPTVLSSTDGDGVIWRSHAARIAEGETSTIRDVNPGNAQDARRIAAALALHKPFGVYDTCLCDDKTTAEHREIAEVGLTCNLLYEACAECCTEGSGEYQSEECADSHDHAMYPGPCATVRALTDAGDATGTGEAP